MAVRRVPKDTNQVLLGYEARWRDADGIQRRRLFKGQSKRRADVFFAEVTSQLSRGTYIDLSSKITVAEYARQWVSIQPYRPASIERRESQIRTHVETSRLGRMRLVAVKPSDVQAFATEKDQLLASASVRNLMGFLSAVFNAAVRDRLIGYSPASKVALSRPELDLVVPLTVEQVRLLAAVVPKPMRAMVLTQAGIGPRIAELLALRVADVDFLRREVKITEQLHPRIRERQVLKTPHSRRTVPLPTVVAEALAAHLAEFPAVNGYIFTNASGLPYQAHTYQQMLSYRAKRAGLPHTTPHDLRHHFASVLLLAGESVVTVAARLGHANANMVIQVYGHLMPNQDERTRRAIDQAWSAVEVLQAQETGL